jgi:TolB-like protein
MMRLFPSTRHGLMRAIMMKSSSILAVCVLLAAPVSAQQAADTRPGVAVMPFFPGASLGLDAEAMGALSIGIQQILITELTTNSALRVVDRSIVRELLAEQDLGASGRVDTETAARIGRVVGAKYVIVGGFNDIQGVFRLDGRVVDAETSEVLKAEQVTDRRDNLYGIITTFGNRLTDGVSLPPLPRAERQLQEVRAAQTPPAAVVLYSLAQQAAERGEADQARELYRRITVEFPRSTHAAEALRQIQGGGLP